MTDYYVKHGLTRLGKKFKSITKARAFAGREYVRLFGHYSDKEEIVIYEDAGFIDLFVPIDVGIVQRVGMALEYYDIAKKKWYYFNLDTGRLYSKR